MEEKMDISIIPKILFFWYVVIFISTETLSYFNLINRSSILLINIIFLTIIIIFSNKKTGQIIKKIFTSRNIFIYTVTIILSLIFLQGFLSAPNTTDSMVRRLPIVMYWVQEHTLYQDTIRNGHDFMGPFSEYIFLHLYLIFNGDRMLFFSQWIAFAVTIILSFIITYYLSGSKKIAFYSSLIVATLPMAVLQATSAQMDMVAAVMVLFSVYFALIFKEKPNVINSFFLGSAIGLGILTKATYLIYVILPIGILVPLILRKWKNLLLLGIFIATIIGVIQARFIEQNLRLYGSVSGERGRSVYMNEFFAPQVIVSNLIRNLIIQLPFPIGKNAIEQAIIYIHDKIGIAVDDPRTNYFDVKFSVNPIIFPQEDRAGNPVHLTMILAAGIILIFSKTKLRNQSLVVYLYLLTIVSFLLFSAVLKWQPFHSRLLMPFFVIGSISSVIILFRFDRLKGMLNLILVISIILAFTLIALNVSKPFLSYNLFLSYVKTLAPPLSSIPESVFTKEREKQYFNARYYWYKPYKEIIGKLERDYKGRTITFKLMDEFEYPLWYFLKKYKSSDRVVPFSIRADETIIISTSKDPYRMDGYDTQCVKTDIEYGYACLSKRW